MKRCKSICLFGDLWEKRKSKREREGGEIEEGSEKEKEGEFY